jgi:predicted AAA+ superfamily ATPase
MSISQVEKDNLFKGLGLFLEGFRPFVVDVLIREDGDDWFDSFSNSLSPQKRIALTNSIANGTPPEAALDYQHLQSFALGNKEALKEDFGKKAQSLPTWLGEIVDVRNKIAHFDPVESDEAAKAWIHMKTIAKAIKAKELEAELARLQENKTAQEAKAEETQAAPAAATGTPQAWFRVVSPHLDIRQGRLDESVFAANLAEVALGSGREIYSNPVMFFEKTFFTAGLKSIARTVIKGLNGKEDAENRVISLQTGFGGGKTHTLISLYHVAKGGKQAAASLTVHDLIAYTGEPEFESASIAVFTNTTNDPANGRTTDDGIHLQTIWGELAYQLGGKDAYEIVRKNDEQLIAPAGLFKKVLEQCKPALILIDELADYCVKAAARTVGATTLADQTISFMQELTEAVAGVSNCVAIITLPASAAEVGNSMQAQEILSSLEKRVRRVGADTKPVADEEIYEVIRRRLFENIGDHAQIEAVASSYLHMIDENWMEMPGNLNKLDYKARLKKSYPFHPELIDVFRIRWASSPDFQRTRGVLRLLAAIVSDLWSRKDSLVGSNLLIDAGDVNFANVDALSGQLKRLYGESFGISVIPADVAGSISNAYKIDDAKPQYGAASIAKGIAAVILLNSFGTDGANRGVSVSDIKLNLLEPGGFNHNSINGALDELEGAAHYLYYAQTGATKRYWFHTEPNINILINQAKADVQTPEIEAEILKRLNDKSKLVQAFNVLVNPTGDVPEQTKLTLILLHPQYQADEAKVADNTKKYIEQVATKKGNSERIYRNTILFLGATGNGLSHLVAAIKDYLACRKISDDYATQLKPEPREELKKKIEAASKQVESALVNAYSTVLKHSVKNGLQTVTVKQFREALDGQINYNIPTALMDGGTEWLLEKVGFNTLKNNNLLPTSDQNIRVKDLYEAFLRFDDKPMIKDSEAVRQSVIKYCFEGKFCIASGDGKEFTKYYLGETAPFVDVSDATYWLLDPSKKPQPVIEQPGGEPQPTPPGGEPKPPTPGGQTPEPTARDLKSITVSGKVAIEQFHELFACFIAPFSLSGNKVDINVSFKINSNDANVLNASKPQYKSAKEAAKQLGLNFEEDPS